MATIALMGAGGKMGCRITDNLKGNPAYRVVPVETGQAGVARLAERGLAPRPQAEAVGGADIVVLAVPDVAIGKVTHDIVPSLRSGTLVVGLDPAAPLAGVMPQRKDVSFFVCHPTHPPLFNDETDPRAQHDWFGGIAKQDVVCALFAGAEEHYAVGERLAREMFRPVKDTYRVTVEQMAVLEPALVETFSSTLVEALREGFDEAVRMGVPEPAARAFFMGHIRIQFAVLFGYADFGFSDGAKLAMKLARDLLLKPDWKQKVFDRAAIRRSVQNIVEGIQQPK
ncbi:MAG TPA: phosphogluconate dehydrogenase C-terminal domain-containing protein [Anaeromyxobacter sp.]|nr:phosphogluconate dehydrogenase C-terminal domain-containing protein [Anaeromyxobacter sp.]